MAVTRHYGHLPRARTQAICCTYMYSLVRNLIKLLLLFRHFKSLYLALYLALSVKNLDTGCIHCICATEPCICQLQLELGIGLNCT